MGYAFSSFSRAPSIGMYGGDLRRASAKTKVLDRLKRIQLATHSNTIMIERNLHQKFVA